MDRHILVVNGRLYSSRKVSLRNRISIRICETLVDSIWEALHSLCSLSELFNFSLNENYLWNDTLRLEIVNICQ